MRNQIRGAVNTRKKMKTYSRCFCFYFICLAVVVVALIFGFIKLYKIMENYKKLHGKVHQLEYIHKEGKHD